jgi:hypothetical protein
MTITTCLTVSRGLQDIEVEIEVECAIEVISYTPRERAGRNCEGEPEQIQWECHLVRPLRVGSVPVMAAGARVDLTRSQAREMERALLAEGRSARELARAGL